MRVKGIQITGQAKLLFDSDAGYADAWKIFNHANAGKEGWDIPPEGYTLLIIESRKIELYETAMKQNGYKIRQVWEAES